MNKAISGFSSVSLSVEKNMPPYLRFDEVTKDALFFSFERNWKSECSQLGPDRILTESSQLICTSVDQVPDCKVQARLKPELLKAYPAF